MCPSPNPDERIHILPSHLKSILILYSHLSLVLKICAFVQLSPPKPLHATCQNIIAIRVDLITQYLVRSRNNENTHYAILFSVSWYYLPLRPKYPRKQWLGERASVLHCLSCLDTHLFLTHIMEFI